MRKSLVLFSLILFSSILLNSCKKDDVVDPADKYVGTYTYAMTVSFASGTQTGFLTITKKAKDKLSILQAEGGAPTLYTVTDNSIIEDGNQFAPMPISANGQTADFLESSTGILKSFELTINGSWSRTGYTTASFKIIASKSN